MNSNEQLLLEVLRDVLVEGRLLARKNECARAAELCDAFHNVPTNILKSKEDMERVLYYVEEYELKYKDDLHYKFADRLKTLSIVSE